MTSKLNNLFYALFTRAQSKKHSVINPRNILPNNPLIMGVPSIINQSRPEPGKSTTSRTSTTSVSPHKRYIDSLNATKQIDQLSKINTSSSKFIWSFEHHSDINGILTAYNLANTLNFGNEDLICLEQHIAPFAENERFIKRIQEHQQNPSEKPLELLALEKFRDTLDNTVFRATLAIQERYQLDDVQAIEIAANFFELNMAFAKLVAEKRIPVLTMFRSPMPTDDPYRGRFFAERQFNKLTAKAKRVLGYAGADHAHELDIAAKEWFEQDPEKKPSIKSYGLMKRYPGHAVIPNPLIYDSALLPHYVLKFIDHSGSEQAQSLDTQQVKITTIDGLERIHENSCIIFPPQANKESKDDE